MKKTFILLLFVLLLPSCSEKIEIDTSANSSISSEEAVTTEEIHSEVPIEKEEYLSDITGELNIFVQMPSYQFEEEIKLFQKAYPNVTVNIEKASDFYKYQDQIRVSLMSGNETPFDLFMMTPETQLVFADSPYVVDLNHFIDNDPEFNMDEYYVNVFKAAETNEKLGAFPTGCRNEYVLLNDEFLNSEIGDMFLSEKAHSYESLLKIYDQLEIKEDTYLINNFSLYVMATNRPYLDFFGNQAFYDTNEFRETAVKAKIATHPNLNTLDTSGILLNYDEYLGVSGSTFLFGIVNDRSTVVDFLPNNELFFDFKQADVSLNSQYDNARPLVNEFGEVYTGLADLYSIPEKAKNKEVAWLFLKFIVSEECLGHMVNDNIFYTPVNKAIDRESKMNLANELITKRFSESDREAVNSEINRVIDFLIETENLPKQSTGFVDIPGVYELVWDYHKNLIDVDQMIEQLNSIVSLYFAERQ